MKKLLTSTIIGAALVAGSFSAQAQDGSRPSSLTSQQLQIMVLHRAICNGVPGPVNQILRGMMGKKAFKQAYGDGVTPRQAKQFCRLVAVAAKNYKSGSGS